MQRGPSEAATREARGRRFILVDQSITGLGGHHYEYAHRVLGAVETDDKLPWLITNRRFVTDKTLPYPVVPHYKRGFWRASKPNILRRLARGAARSYRQFRFRSKTLLCFSLLGILWEARRRPWDLLVDVHAYLRPSSVLLASAAVVLLAPFAAVALVAIGLLSGLRWVVRQLARLVPGRLRQAFGGILGSLRRPPWWIKTVVRESSARASFRKDTQRLLRRLDVRRGDVIFFPTVSTWEILGLSEAIARGPKSAFLADWHVVLRRNVYVGREPEYRSQDESMRRLRNVLRIAVKNCPSMRFYTDTEPLTRQYNRLHVADFSTLPVPIAPAATISRLEHVSPAFRQSKRFRATYLGDARTEKGYRFLPHIVSGVQDLIDDGSVECVFQSNFNNVDGEPDAAASRYQLESTPGVTLLKEPLDSEAYAQALVDSDCLLLPYDAENYYARSSGVFAEALAAGVPTIVPSGSWMALALAEARSRYHLGLQKRALWAQGYDPAHLERKRPTAGSVPGLTSEIQSIALDAAPSRDFVFSTRRRHFDVVLPQSVTHVLVSYASKPTNGEFLRAELRERRYGHLGYPDIQVAGGAERNSMLFALRSPVRDIRISISPAYGDLPHLAQDLRIVALRLDTQVPVSTVGVCYEDPMDLAACLREIVLHRGHYRTSARLFALNWSKKHAPGTLVRALLGQHHAHWSQGGAPRVTSPGQERASAMDLAS